MYKKMFVNFVYIDLKLNLELNLRLNRLTVLSTDKFTFLKNKTKKKPNLKLELIF